jgi:hypothetical protein
MIHQASIVKNVYYHTVKKNSFSDASIFKYSEKCVLPYSNKKTALVMPVQSSIRSLVNRF